VGYFFIGKQKVVLFPKHRENGWESVVNALTKTSLVKRKEWILEKGKKIFN
jgi:hypothetical protein